MTHQPRQDPAITVKEILSLWPSRADLSVDLGDSPETIRKWEAAGAIPLPRHADLLAAANRRGYVAKLFHERGIYLSGDLLVAIHAGPPRRLRRTSRRHTDA